MFCINCGKEMSDTNKYCRYCGAKVKQSEPIEQPEPIEQTESIEQPQKRKSNNIIAMHWRGDFSLGVSYWVFGFCLSIFFQLIAPLFKSVSYLPPKPSALILVSSLLFIIIATVWQLVGIWRSASKHTTRGGKPSWAMITKIAVVIGSISAVGNINSQLLPIISQSVKTVIQGEQVPHYSLRLLRNGKELEVSGGISYGVTKAVKEMLKASPNVEVIHMNSIGGWIKEAKKLHDLIRSKKLITFTSTHCESACTIAFLGGRERYLGENGKIGFHSASIDGKTTVEGTNDEQIKVLRKSGAAYAFINKLVNISPNSMWYPTNQELLDNHIITAVVDSWEYGSSGISDWRNMHSYESGLLKVPYFASMKKYDPDNYALIRKILLDGMKNGDSLSDITDSSSTLFMNKMLPIYVRTANSDSTYKYLQAEVGLFKEIQRKSPSLCAKLLMGGSGVHHKVMRLVSKDVKSRELDALNGLVISSATSPNNTFSKKEAEQNFTQMLLSLAKAGQLNANVIVSPEKYSDKPDVLCGTFVKMFDGIQNLPKQKAANVMAYVLIVGAE